MNSRDPSSNHRQTLVRPSNPTVPVNSSDPRHPMTYTGRNLCRFDDFFRAVVVSPNVISVSSVDIEFDLYLAISLVTHGPIGCIKSIIAVTIVLFFLLCDSRIRANLTRRKDGTLT